MTARAKQVILAGLFWIAFGIPIAIVMATLPLAILCYALGNENIRAYVYRTGKAMDQLCNASLFGGHPKETVSSHVGRWIVAGQPSMPWVWRFYLVDWLTGLFEANHCTKAIEAPFVGESL